MRLDKFIANNSSYSRTDVKKLIRQKAVSINGEVVTSPASTVSEHCSVSVLGLPIHAYQPLYIMLNKPVGYVSANKDNLNPVLVELIRTENYAGPGSASSAHAESRRSELQIAGRLDMDTTGLVLLTSDGDWNHLVTSPRKNCFKRYRVTLSTPITKSAITQLESGVELHGENKPTLPAIVEFVSEREIILSIQEGKFHQVKRMMHKVGNEVSALHREAIGHIELDTSLSSGQWRYLTETELSGFL